MGIHERWRAQEGRSGSIALNASCGKEKVYVPKVPGKCGDDDRQCDVHGRAHRPRDEQIPLENRKTKGTAMRLVDSLLMEIDQEAQTTKRVLDRVPEDKLAWKPHPKSYSLGQLALHIASVPGSVASLAERDTMEVSTFSQAEAKSRKEVLDTFSKSLESAKETLNKMDDARLMATWKLTKNGRVLMSVPRIGFIRSILMNQTYHHRGQLSVYLRMLDVPVPSIYGPSADENPFA
jgi:uncharacterized damage-inducible protein DinB